jgi:hypothetical protein
MVLLKFQKKTFMFLIPQTFFRNVAVRPNEKVAGSQKDIRKIIIQVESNFNDENEDKT